MKTALKLMIGWGLMAGMVAGASTESLPERVIIRYKAGHRAPGVGPARLAVLTLSKGTSIDDVRSQEGVASVERDYPVTLVEWNDTMDFASVASKKPYTNQWGLEAIQAAEGWAVTTGDAGVMVAVIDTGVDADHPDLAGHVIDGHDYADGDNDPEDLHGHGTHVAGIIAGQGSHTGGVVGVAPGVTILAIRALNAQGQGYMFDIAMAIEEAVRRGADVINLSIRSPKSRILEEAIRNAVNRGVIVVAAAGNSGLPEVAYPAAYEGVVAVSALDEEGNLAPFSNHAVATVVAPGVKIFSTLLDGEYGVKSGTSMAAPHVAGLAALLVSAYPRMTAGAIRQRIAFKTDDLGTAGPDSLYGHGRVNARRVLTGLRPPAHDLDEVVVFPNPVRFSTAARGTVKFAGLTEGSTVRIFTLTGNEVKAVTLGSNGTIINGDQVEWDGRNDQGDQAAMGTYFYLVTDPSGGRKTGKLGVLPE